MINRYVFIHPNDNATQTKWLTTQQFALGTLQ